MQILNRRQASAYPAGMPFLKINDQVRSKLLFSIIFVVDYF